MKKRMLDVIFFSSELFHPTSAKFMKYGHEGYLDSHQYYLAQTNL